MQATLAMALTAALFATLFYRLCRRTFAGETAGEGSRRVGAVQTSPGWSFPFLGGPACAALEKELRYLLKDPRLFTNLFMVWAFAFASSFGSGMFKDAFHIDAARGGNLYPAMTGYSLLVINMLCFNNFGNDSPGFQRWLLAPIPIRGVIVAKNLAFAVIVATDMVVITTIFCLRSPLPPALLAKTLLGVGYVTLAMVAVGNVFSVWFPKKIVPGKLSGKNVSEAGVIISMLVMVALGASWFAAFSLAPRTHIPWLSYASFAFFILVAAALYVLSLRIAPRYITKRLDNLLAELG
jgi:hypothetical protein